MIDLRNHRFATKFCQIASKQEFEQIDWDFLEKFDGTNFLEVATKFFYHQSSPNTAISEEELKSKTITVSNGDDIGIDDIKKAIELDGQISYLKMLMHLEAVFLTSQDLTYIMKQEVEGNEIVPNNGIRFPSILIYAPYETAVVYFGIKYICFEQEPGLHNSIMNYLDMTLEKSGLEPGVMDTPLSEEELEQFIDAFKTMNEEIGEIIEAYGSAKRVYGNSIPPKGINLN